MRDGTIAENKSQRGKNPPRNIQALNDMRRKSNFAADHRDLRLHGQEDFSRPMKTRSGQFAANRLC